MSGDSSTKDRRRKDGDRRRDKDDGVKKDKNKRRDEDEDRDGRKGRDEDREDRRRGSNKYGDHDKVSDERVHLHEVSDKDKNRYGDSDTEDERDRQKDRDRERQKKNRDEKHKDKREDDRGRDKDRRDDRGRDKDKDRKVRLGKGAYGEVYAEGGYAVKYFDRTSFAIQEWVCGRYLRNVSGIPKFNEIDVKAVKVSMELYDTNLERLIRDMVKEKKPKISFTEKKNIAYDILVALAELHGRALVHGDVKLLNILVRDMGPDHDGGRYKVALGDLGFVSLALYSKVEYTTSVYSRDKSTSPSHDVYSMGISLLELFGNMSVERMLSRSQIKKYVKEQVSDKVIGQCILDMTRDETKDRPTIPEVIGSIYKEKWICELSPFPPEKETTYRPHKDMIAWLQRRCKDYKIPRWESGKNALIEFFERKGYTEKDTKKMETYAMAMIVIMSAVFYKDEEGINCDTISKNQFAGKHRESDVRDSLGVLLSSEYSKMIVDHVLSP